MIDEDYVSIFLELLRYVPYLKEEKEKIHRFIIGFPVSFKDKIVFDEPRSLEESIRKMKHYYEQSKHKSESKKDWKVHISSDKGKDVEDVKVLRRYPVLQQFQDVFPAEILELPPQREVEFSIELMSREAPASNTPYMMSTPALLELKL
eukprot:PITA_26409